MREILFRGKRIDNSKWVEGFYVLDPQADEGKESQIYYTNKHPCGWALVPFVVTPETVGQYTGLTDKNGKKIFEGDIVKFYDNCSTFCDIGYILYKDENAKFLYYTSDSIVGYSIDSTCILEVIGNIHDNPELLKSIEKGEK